MLHPNCFAEKNSRLTRKKSLTELLLSRTNKLIRGATLIHGSSRALCRIPSYPRQVTPACASQNTPGLTRLTAPSAVHLTMCFLPDSHPRRLSVKASLPLSPLQRFSLYAIFNRDYSNLASVRQRKIITHSAAKLQTTTRSFTTPYSRRSPPKSKDCPRYAAHTRSPRGPFW